jgi:hypothetical protein
MNAADEKFLVQLVVGCFVAAVDGTTISTTEIPSRAAHVTYTAADQWTQRFKGRGFPQAVVTNHLGEPMTYTEIQSELRATSKPLVLPTSRRELARIPADEQRRRYRTDPAFAQRFDELEAQS